MKPTRSDEIRSDLTQTMARQGVPGDRAGEKIERHMQGLKAIEKGETQARVLALVAMGIVGLLAGLERLTPWVLLFFAAPMLWGLAQAARGTVLLSSDVLRHMDERSMRQLSWFQRWVVTLVKTAKGIRGS